MARTRDSRLRGHQNRCGARQTRPPGMVPQQAGTRGSCPSYRWCPRERAPDPRRPCPHRDPCTRCCNPQHRLPVQLTASARLQTSPKPIPPLVMSASADAKHDVASTCRHRSQHFAQTSSQASCQRMHPAIAHALCWLACCVPASCVNSCFAISKLN